MQKLLKTGKLVYCLEFRIDHCLQEYYEDKSEGLEL